MDLESNHNDSFSKYNKNMVADYSFNLIKQIKTELSSEINLTKIEGEKYKSYKNNDEQLLSRLMS